MKKFFAIVLSLLMILSLAACGGNETTTAAADVTTGEASTDETTTAVADSDMAYVKNNGKLIIGITDFAPMDYQDGSDEWIGFDADAAKAFAKTLGVEAEFIEIVWESKELELDNKNIDCVWNGMTLNDGVMAAMETSNPYCNNAQIIVVKKSIADTIKTAEDARTLSFAVEGGSVGEDAAKENNFNYTAVESQSDAVMEVAAGTSDACIIDSLMAAAMVGEGTSYPDLTYTVGLTEEFYGVGFRKGSDLAAALNQYFIDAYADGSLKALADTYGITASLIEQK